MIAMSLTNTPSLNPTCSVLRVADIPFGQAVNIEGQLETLHLDVYLPEDGSDALRPAVIWFHGGGFMPGNDKRQIYIPRFANAFAERGYVGIAPDYRVRAEPLADSAATLRDAVTDARSALVWVRANSAAYRIDPNCIILAGGSAGGMTVLNLVHDSDPSLGDAPLESVVAVLDLWGTPGETYRHYAQLNPATPPTFIIHGTADQLVSYQLSQDFMTELEQAGATGELLTLPDAPHTPLRHFDEMIVAIGIFLNKILAR